MKISNIQERGASSLRFFDLIFGSLFLFCASFFIKKKPQIPEKIENICIFSFAAVGDSILSSILFDQIKNKYKNVTVTVICSKTNASVYECFANVDQVLQISIFNLFSSYFTLRTLNFDILIDTSQWPRISAIYSLFVESSYKIGFKTIRQYRHYCYDYSVLHRQDIHELENFKNLMQPLKISTTTLPKLVISNKAKVIKHDFTNFVVIHPWASGTQYSKRELPFITWYKVIEHLIANNYSVVITGGKKDFNKTEMLIQNFKDNVFNLAGKTSFVELYFLLKSAQGLLSVNTGIMHFGCICDIPVLSINGPTDEIRWGAWGRHSSNLSVPKEKGGAHLSLGFEYKNSKYIMDKISHHAIISSFSSLINQSNM